MSVWAISFVGAEKYCKVNEDGGYHFIILPNIIYAFITGGRRYSFVAAYDQKMLKVDLDHINYRKEYHHITDMSHQPRSYFLKYCDVKDSKAVAAGWQYETKNGYRDGRRQGNNFFIVKFSYTTVNYSWGKLQTTTAFSCTAVYALIWDAFKVYKEMLMYGKEASNRKQEIDRQHYTIPNQRPKDKHCGKI